MFLPMPGVAENLGGRFGEVVQVDEPIAFMLAEALRCRFGKTRYAAQAEVTLVRA